MLAGGLRSARETRWARPSTTTRPAVLAIDNTTTARYPDCEAGAPVRAYYLWPHELYDHASDVHLYDPTTDPTPRLTLPTNPVPDATTLRNLINQTLADPSMRDLSTGLEDALEPIIPSCDGMTYDACVQLLVAAGFTASDIQRNTLDFDHADLGRPANAVTALSPYAGTKTPSITTITITTNPDATSMPVAVPTVSSSETLDEYTGALALVGLRAAPQALAEDNPDLVPDGVDHVEPADRAHDNQEIEVVYDPTSRSGQ